MAREDIRRASLAELRQMKDDGLLDTDLPEMEGPPPGEELPADFWDNAKIVFPKEPRSVHLKLDPDVFDYFKRQGKGHLTRMQEVLRAYVNAQRGSRR
ncbi:MAG TPA: BrnA antitoxin family protein [Devosia sp.]|nr:BrnA antitoxin family protein [Devosia sp.]